MKRKKSILLDMNPLDIWQIIHIKDTMLAKQVTERLQEMTAVYVAPAMPVL